MAHYLPDEAADPLARQVLLFWFGDPPEHGSRLKRWFIKDAAFDTRCRELFLSLYEELARGARREWLEHAADCLARVIVLDQFPRNMFRGTARAFAADALALEAARHAIAEGYDREMTPVERLFAYLPFEHSETLVDQERACDLNAPLAAFSETEDVYRYAVAHRDIIARFGRFPHRNAILGRTSTPEEIEFLKQPGSSF
jgi:uncharacterized protein (DUF924 family)